MSARDRKPNRKPAEARKPGPGMGNTTDTAEAVQRPPQARLDPLELQAVALHALRDVAQAADAPAAAKAAAARTLLEYAGAIGRHAEPAAKAASKPASEMTLAELDAAIAAEIAERGAP